MDYIHTNKSAWEEAFSKHQAGYKKKYTQDLADVLAQDAVAFLNEDTLKELTSLNMQGKDAAQFCCNNGRELLSIMKLGLQSGTGFDIAENFIREGNRMATKLKYNCRFIAKNIYDIGDDFKNQFDLLLITIGALCWFDNLDLFFEKVALVLKDGGHLLINEQHPFMNMLAFDGDEEYDPENPKKIAFSYFRSQPWIENNGMDYIGMTSYKSKTFTDFSHTLSEILNSLSKNNINIVKFNEYSYDISNCFDAVNNREMPLSYILIGKKHGS